MRYKKFALLMHTVNIWNPNKFGFRTDHNGRLSNCSGFGQKFVSEILKKMTVQTKPVPNWFGTGFIFKIRHQTGFVQFSDILCPICPQIHRIFKYKPVLFGFGSDFQQLVWNPTFEIQTKKTGPKRSKSEHSKTEHSKTHLVHVPISTLFGFWTFGFRTF